MDTRRTTNARLCLQDATRCLHWSGDYLRRYLLSPKRPAQFRREARRHLASSLEWLDRAEWYLAPAEARG